MKNTDKTIARLGVVVLALSIAACASTPLERQDAASTSLVELRDAMMATRGQIAQTLASLDELTNAAPDGLRDAYEQYAQDANTIAQQAVTVDSESRRMQQHSDAWLSAWEKSQADVDNAELRAIGERRRAQALERFQNMDGSFAAAREAFAPFIANLQDVKTVVGNDLTPRGVAAVANSSVVRNANESGVAAARALDITISDLRVLTETLAPSAVVTR